MEKLERRTDLTGAGFERISAGLKKMKNLFLHHTHSLFFYKGFIYVVLGFLLGRAFILSEIMPFALPFFGSMLLIKRDKAMLACLALLAGAMTISPQNALFVFASLIVFLLMSKVVSFIIKDPVKTLPVVIVLS
ncbi:stage II sporulation protein E, partial [Bacillus altitudinis]|nr:stage II sporulation protein E [Bacillus altitudinis]